MAQIECKNLTLSYDNRIVLRDLTFSLVAGSYLSVVGDNGSGKSTLAKALMSLKEPSEGEILFGDGLKRSDIGYLGQMREMQKDFPASVYEVVLSGCLNSRGLRPFYNKKERERADANMKKLGITELKKCSYRALSGGQQQRVLLARALCAAKKLILLDEPVSGLDVSVTRDFYSILEELNRDGVTVIMVSHDIENSLKYSSHILHLDNRPLFFGTTEEYIASGIPYDRMGGQ